MQVIFYNNTTDSDHMTKSLSNAQTMTCSLKTPTNRQNPRLVVTKGWRNKNYCYIQEFGRYYYITDVEYLDNNKVSISCKCDVLMSFKSNILNATGILKRDGQRRGKSRSIEDKYLVTNGDVAGYFKTFPVSLYANPQFVLLVSGG